MTPTDEQIWIIFGGPDYYPSGGMGDLLFVKDRLPDPAVFERYAQINLCYWFQICRLEREPPYLFLVYTGHRRILYDAAVWTWNIGR